MPFEITLEVSQNSNNDVPYYFYSSKLEHTAHYKAKNGEESKHSKKLTRVRE